ncbi:hypothetical protein TNCV_361521 [Trichonephila clavipes]|nr:hypothetical protein TNCV_361521 [Trichonephila clavipes]
MTHAQSAEEERSTVERVRYNLITNHVANRCRRVLTMCLPMEVRTVIHYEYKREASVPVIHERLQTVYNEEIMFRLIVGRWCCMFNKGKQQGS